MQKFCLSCINGIAIREWDVIAFNTITKKEMQQVEQLKKTYNAYVDRLLVLSQISHVLTH